MRVLLLAEGNAESWDSWSGSARSLVMHLRQAGHQVVVGDVDCYGPVKYLAAALTYSRNRARWSARFHLASGPFKLRSRNAERHITEFRDSIDLIIQIGGTFAPSGRGRIPYAVYCDSNICIAERGAATGYSDAFLLTASELAQVRAREAQVYHDAHVVLTMSDYLRQSFLDDFNLSPDRVKTVHAGLNLDLSAIPYPLTKDAGSPPTVLFVGKQFERKGGDLLLKAFRRVREQLPTARLVIIGPPTLETSQPGVETLGFLNKSTPAGWAALCRAYSQADVFCLPTRFEPFGISFLEAMFFGVPCVGTNAFAIPEMVRDGETGYLVPPDAGALADKLILLLQNPELCRAMGAAGRRRAESHFTWSATVNRIEHSLGSLIGSNESLQPEWGVGC